jgi:hypothetical protein
MTPYSCDLVLCVFFVQVNMGAAAAAVFAAASLMVAPISMAADAASIKVGWNTMPTQPCLQGLGY